MIVVSIKHGQLGNRLISASSLIAASREYGFWFADPAFEDYSRWFEGTSRNLLCSYPAVHLPVTPKPEMRKLLFRAFASVTNRLITRKRLGPIHSIEPIVVPIVDLKSPTFRKYCGPGVFLMDGWHYMNGDLIRKHSDAIKKHFTPIRSVRDEVDRAIAEARKDCDILVGLHIRQTDNRTYAGGKFFYSSETYAQIGERMLKLLEGRGRVRFLICVDERQDYSLFNKLSYTKGPGGIASDMYSLAKCDYIVGVFSSYTRWSSFYGGVPLRLVMTPDEQFTLDDFCIYDTLTHLSPGEGDLLIETLP